MDTLIQRTMDNLNGKLSLENEKQPSCLGAVSTNTLFDKEFENLWKGKELKPRHYDGDKNWDNDNNIKIAFETLWGK